MHGDLDKVYETIRHIEKNNQTKIDLLLCCGDFQVTLISLSLCFQKLVELSVCVVFCWLALGCEE